MSLGKSEQSAWLLILNMSSKLSEKIGDTSRLASLVATILFSF